MASLLDSLLFGDLKINDRKQDIIYFSHLGTLALTL
jgi:hypothetical protein